MSARKIGAIDFRWKEPLGNPECPHAYRWALIVFGYGLRLHHWIGDDDNRAFHDHPWWMLIFMLKGKYVDVNPYEYGENWDVVSADLVGFRDRFRFRPAEWKHRIKLVYGECWTVVLTGPKVRNWGFWIPGRDKLLRPLRYFSRFGHHPCD